MGLETIQIEKKHVWKSKHTQIHSIFNKITNGHWIESFNIVEQFKFSSFDPAGKI